MKDKTHMIISIHAEKASDKIQHLFMMKILSKVEMEGTYLNLIQTTYNTHPASVILGEKLKTLSLRSETRQGCLLSPLLPNIREENEIKAIHIGKERVKLSLFANDMILYRENPEESTKKSTKTNKQIQ